MGTGITIRCRDCTYRKDFMLGVGMLFSSLENVIDLVTQNQQAKVLDILHNHRINKRSFSQAIFHCPGCSHLSNRLFFQIQYDGSQKIQSEHACPKCRTKMKRINQQVINTLPCPSCKKTSLHIAKDESMLWD